MIQGARYVHTNLIARDWRTLASFYQSLFGCVVGNGPNGPTLEIFTYSRLAEGLSPAVNRPGLAHLAFEVESVPEARSAVLAAGGKAVGSIVILDTANGARVTWCYVTDPEGNIIELQSWSQQPARNSD